MSFLHNIFPDTSSLKLEAIRSKIIKNNTIYYEVKWRGHPEAKNTIETIENIKDYQEAVCDFERMLFKKNHLRKAKVKPNNHNVIVIDDDDDEGEEVEVSNLVTKSQVTQSTRSHQTREFESFEWQKDHRKSHELSSFLEDQLRKSQEKVRKGSKCLLIDDDDDDDEVGGRRLDFDEEENSLGFERKTRKNNFTEEKRGKTKEKEEESLEQNLKKGRKESSEGDKLKNGMMGKDWGVNGKTEKLENHEKLGASHRKLELHEKLGESYKKLCGDDGRERKESEAFLNGMNGETVKNNNKVDGFNSGKRSREEDLKDEAKRKASDTGKSSGHKVFDDEVVIETDSKNGKASKKELITKNERKKSKDEHEKLKDSDHLLKTSTIKETKNTTPPTKEVKLTTRELILKEYSSRAVDPSSLKLFDEIGLNATLKKMEGINKKPEGSEKDKVKNDKNPKNPEKDEKHDKKPTLNTKNLKKPKETKERSKSPKERQHTHTHNLRRKPRKRSKSIANSVKSKEKSKKERSSDVTDWRKYQQSNYDFSTSVRSKKISKDSKTKYYRNKYTNRKTDSHSSKVSQHHHHHAKSISPECSSSKPFERFHSQEKEKWGIECEFKKKDNNQREHSHSQNRENTPKWNNDKDLSHLSQNKESTPKRNNDKDLSHSSQNRESTPPKWNNDKYLSHLSQKKESTPKWNNDKNLSHSSQNRESTPPKWNNDKEISHSSQNKQSIPKSNNDKDLSHLSQNRESTPPKWNNDKEIYQNKQSTPKSNNDKDLSHFQNKESTPKLNNDKDLSLFSQNKESNPKWNNDKNLSIFSQNKESTPKWNNDKDLSHFVMEKLDRELDMMRDESPIKFIKEKEAKKKEIDNNNVSFEKESAHPSEKKPFNQPENNNPSLFFSLETNINPPAFPMTYQPPIIQNNFLPNQTCPEPLENGIENVSLPQRPSEQQEPIQESSSQDTAKLFSPLEENSQPSPILENKPAPPSDEVIKSFLQEIHDMRGAELAKELKIEPLCIGNLRRDKIKEVKAMVVKGKDRKDWFGQVAWHVRKNKDHMGTTILPFEEIMKAAPKETAWFLAKLFRKEIRDNLM